MKALSQNELKKVIGGVSGTGDQGGSPIEKPKTQSVIQPDPIKEPVLKTGG